MVMVMIDKLKLGVVLNGQKEIINHRSFIKVIFNPFIRLLGYNIATKYNNVSKVLGMPVIMKCNKHKCISFLYDNEDEHHILKRRMFI